MIVIISKLSDIDALKLFEKQHPTPLRWTFAQKKAFLKNPNSQLFWIKVGNKVVGEIMLEWLSTSVVEVIGLTILPEFRGKGYSKTLIGHSLAWARSRGFKYMIGQARLGASWNVFKNFGAKRVAEYDDWGGSGETYIGFKINL